MAPVIFFLISIKSNLWEASYINLIFMNHVNPDGAYLVTNHGGNNRSFSRSYYNYKSKGDINVERK